MRKGAVKRDTAETKISLKLDLDGTGKAAVATGIGFLDHMLTLLARHSLIDMEIKAKGDLEVDDHKKGIARYADCLMPMDETLTRVAVDISGRPFLVFRTAFPTQKIGTFDSELVREWFQAFAINAGLTLHVETLYGANSHHIAESCFKGLARVLRMAVAIDPRAKDRVPSTKGTLSD
jgi:imidazoleglycerol-phosphate dehydratase